MGPLFWEHPSLRPLPNVKLKVFFSNFTMIPNEYPPSSIRFKKIWKLPTWWVWYIRCPPITLPQIVEGFTCVLLVLIKSGPWEMKRTKLLDCYIDDIYCSQTYIRVCFHPSIHPRLLTTYITHLHPSILACNIHTHLYSSKMDYLQYTCPFAFG